MGWCGYTHCKDVYVVTGGMTVLQSVELIVNIY